MPEHLLITKSHPHNLPEVEESLTHLEKQLHYLQSHDGWEPFKYNYFVKQMETSLELLDDMVRKFSGDTQRKFIYDRAVLLRNKYKKLQEVEFS